VGNDDSRFCGKPLNFCQVIAHSKNTVGDVSRGWYISLGKTQGILTSPRLPHHDEGGPIRGAAPSRLVMGDNSFRLTRGQWKFIFDAWQASRVEILSDTTTDSGTPSPSSEIPQPILPAGFTQTALPLALDSTEVTNPNTHFFPASILRGNSPPVESVFNVPSTSTSLLESCLAATEQMVLALASKNQTLEDALQNQRRQYEESLATHQTFVQVVQTRFVAMDSQLHALRSPTGDGAQLDQDRLNALDEAMFSSNGLISRFKTSFTDFREKFESSGGIECHGMVFKSKRDCVDWYARNSGGLRIEIFLDALAMLNAIRAPVVHPDEATRQWEAQKKTEMKSSLEVGVISSFETILPCIFVGGRRVTDTGLGGTYDWLKSYLKSFDVCKPSGNLGMSHQVLDGVKSVAKRAYEVQGQVAGPDALMLAVL
jgi:hypothetical protein